MLFSKIIENIRKKPEHIRARYLWFSILICMSFVFLVWLSSVKSGIEKIKMSDDDNEETQSITDSIQSSIEGMKEEGEEYKESLNALKELVTEDSSNEEKD